ncbi:MAG: energy transducer TonB [Parahaliea sp.]
MTLALGLHTVLLGFSFEAGVAERRDYPQLDVTLVLQPSQPAPDRATHLAQNSQQGSGNQARLEQAGGQAAPAAMALPPIRPEAQRLSGRSLKQRAITTSAQADQRQFRDKTPPGQKEASLLGISPEADQLSHQLASLEAALDAQSEAYSSLPRIRRLTSVSAREATDAAYLASWRKRVEAVGNKYYPEASVRYGIYGNLRLLVVIDNSGRLDNVRVLSSSGYALLDEAAIKIVRMAAPYAPFPPELRATTDKLEIIRTWQFQENRLSSG